MKLAPKIKIVHTNNEKIDLIVEPVAALNSEVAVSFYPYPRKVDANSYDFEPYSEYIKDVSSGLRSAYRELNNNSGIYFGLLLGFLIAVIFAIIDPQLLVSVESIVSILGAYTIGKELWRDIDNTLTRFTSSWKVSWRPRQYQYEKEHQGTMQSFMSYARKQRYQGNSELAQNFSLVSQSNSQIWDGNFSSSLLKNGGRVLTITADNISKMLNEGSLLTIKLTLIHIGFLGVHWQTELFQSIQNGSDLGVIYKDSWVSNYLLQRKSIKWGRFKLYLNTAVVKRTLIDY